MLTSMRNLFPENDNLIEDREFSRLHKAVLKLEHCDLEQEVKAYSSILDSTDTDGFTPLIWAARRGDRKAIWTLVKAGADVNFQTNYGASALYYTVKFCDLESVKALLNAGANPCLVNKWGHSPLHHVRYATPSLTEMVASLIDAGIDLNIKDSCGLTPLHTSTFNNNVEAARAFLDHGANINALDNDRDSVLSQCLLLGSNDVAELLLSRGATCTSWDSMCNSILHLAALSGNLKTIEILYRAKLHTVDPDAVSRQGQTALQIAKARVSKAEGFVEKLQELLMDIRIRNAELRKSEAKRKDAAPDLPKTQSTSEPHSFRSKMLERCHMLQDTWHRIAPIFRNLVWKLLLACLLFSSIYRVTLYTYRVLGFDRVGPSLAHVWSMFGPGDFMEL